MNQKRDIYNDLQHALEVMKYTDEKTPRNRVFYAMWLLENRALASGTNIYVSRQFDKFDFERLTSFRILARSGLPAHS